MLTRDQAEKLVKRVIGFSRFEECSVSISEREEAFIRFANNGVTTSGLSLERTIDIASTRGGKTGSSSTTELTDTAIEQAVRLSEELSAIAPQNPERVDPLKPQKYAGFDNWDEETARARSPQLASQVKAVLDVTVAKKLVAAGFFNRNSSIDILGNKEGNFLYERATDSRLTTTIRTPNGSSSGWAGQPSVKLTEVDGARLANIAIEKCERWAQKPVQLPPGKYTVILEPTAVSDLLTMMGGLPMSARRAEEGRSFLSKRGGGTLVGEKLFSETITIKSDPFDRRFPTQLAANDGLPTRPVTWVESGVVKNIVYDRYWALKSGVDATPPFTGIVVAGNDASLQDLIKGVERGLLVTRFWYIRMVNPQTGQATGLTRDGLFLVENGEITKPIVNFRFNESPVRMLQNVVRLGCPQRVRGAEGVGMVVPPMVIKDFNFTSISDAV